MDTNVFSKNISLMQVVETINDTMNNSVNFSAVHVKDLYEEYRVNERHKFLVYRVISYVLAVSIILSNLSVVISSGLILKKGQRPKSTYLLLGNVSLADTIVGFSIVYGLSVDSIKYTLNANPICVFQMGILVCPAMVSILSVGLIAVDRYIYILHGLYYQRWFNTTRVRIGIVLIWIISIILGFMPITGWVNHELAHTRCIYVGLFPGPLILVNSILSIIPIAVVVVLYTFILVKALKTVKTINNTIKIKEISPPNKESQIRINRRTFNERTRNSQPTITDTENNDYKLKRSASCNFGSNFKPDLKYKTNSIENLSNARSTKSNIENLEKDIDKQNKIQFRSDLRAKQSEIQFESDFSVCTVETTTSNQSLPSDNANNQPNQFNISMKKPVRTRKTREPNKWRAIKVVMLTTGSLILTWIPFFVTVIFYVYCEDKLTNPKCIRLRALLGGPFAILAFINSILNPLIYAWWHKGFKASVKTYFKQYLVRYISRVVSHFR